MENKKHLIFYDSCLEAWIDQADESFKIGMTPEGLSSELSKEFNSQEEFWKWYNN